MKDAWALAGRARRDFVDMAEQLDEAQWNTETLCSGWTSHHVLAHLVWHVEQTVPALLIALTRARFDFNRAADRAAHELAKRPSQELLNELRERADEKPSVPGAPETGSVTDTVIHLQDVRRACGLDGTLDPEFVRIGLDFLTTHRNARFIFDPKVLTGLSLNATDIDWTYGSGPEIAGPGEALMMAIVGRPTRPELDGDGLALLADRLDN